MTHALLLAAMVIVRSYNLAQVPPDELAHARATAERTFERAGIPLQWMDCTIGDRPSAIGDRPVACTVPLRQGSEFVLRLMASAGSTDPASSRTIAMGSSLIDHDSGAAALTTVDPGLVLQIARGAGADFSTLLGRAIAHEIGHLLLGHPRHSRSGLMRAIWSQDEIRGIRPSGWQFSGAEAAQMRQRLTSSVRVGNAGAGN